MIAVLLVVSSFATSGNASSPSVREVTKTEWVAALKLTEKPGTTLFFLAAPFRFPSASSFYQIERSFTQRVVTALRVYSKKITPSSSYLIFHFYSLPSYSEEDLIIQQG
jgi:hypothetical protein